MTKSELLFRDARTSGNLALAVASAAGFARVEPEHLLRLDMDKRSGGACAAVAAERGLSLMDLSLRTDARLERAERSVGQARPIFAPELHRQLLRHSLAPGIEWDRLLRDLLDSPDSVLAELPKLAHAREAPDRASSSSSQTGALEKYCLDLTAQAGRGELRAVVGRTRELEAVTTVLAQVVANNPLLLGEPGVGKSAIVDLLAMQIANDAIPFLRGRRVLSLDLGALLAGAIYRGEFEARLKAVVDAVTRERGRVILFVDEVHGLMGAGRAGGGHDAANLLKPALARGELWMIGATTFAEYKQYIESDAAFVRRFQRIDVPEPRPFEVVELLQGVQATFANAHGVTYAQESLSAVVSLSARYLSSHRFPDKAIKVLDRAGARVKLDSAEPGATVDVAAVRQAVAALSGIPVARISDNEWALVEDVRRALMERLVGQTVAIESLVDQLRLALSPLRRSERGPRAVIGLVGPVGVGKTEAARIVASTLHPNEAQLIRLDMGEFADSHSMSRLLGAAPGLVGHDDGGLLTERLWQSPNAVLLLDRLEESSETTQRLFATIFERGEATDTRGRRVSLNECLVLVTSSSEHGLRVIREQLHATITFGALDARHAAEIAVQFGPRMGLDGLTVDEHARRALEAIGIDGSLGARGVQRIMERAIADGLRADPSMSGVGRWVLTHESTRFVIKRDVEERRD